jgi:hypothetical protein
MKIRLLVILVILQFDVPLFAQPNTCSYSTYKWNAIEREAVDFQRVVKPYAELSENEIDSVTGCSACEQDQVTIQIGDLPPFKVCYVLADSIRDAIQASLTEGQVIVELAGYRVGLTRGEVDSDGNRTEFSNHSYGTAVDINTSFNGLYDNCRTFNKNCRLIKGGRWDPNIEESIRADSPLVQVMLDIGMHWGGKIQGVQKDFMHFSLTGY